MMEEILNKIQKIYSLRRLDILHNTNRKIVFLMEDQKLNKYVLKIFKKFSRNIRKEANFLETVNNSNFSYISFPKLFESGRNYLLFEYHEREHLTRETVLKRNWQPVDILIWVSGLIEFQKIEVNYRYFLPKERIRGYVYPIYFFYSKLLRFYKILGMKGFFCALKLTFYYFYFRLFIKNVNTHYDLQTSNYTFLLSAEKMSMIDFEMRTYKGDPLYDILHYITIPVQSLSEWTFQVDLLREFLKRIKIVKNISRGLTHRFRLILLICLAERFMRFSSNPSKQKVLKDNIEFLLSNSKFKKWYRDILSSC